jgi:hypothetical protein
MSKRFLTVVVEDIETVAFDTLQEWLFYILKIRRCCRSKMLLPKNIVFFLMWFVLYFSRIIEEIGFEAAKHSPGLLDVLIDFSSDDRDAIVNKSIVSGSNIFHSFFPQVILLWFSYVIAQ